MAGKLFKQYKEEQGAGNSSLYKKYKSSIDSGLSTGNSTMDRYIEHRRQQEETAKERKRLRDTRINRETRERQVKNASLNKDRATMTDFMRQEREKIQSDHVAEASQARLFSGADLTEMKSLAETAKKKRDTARQNYLEKKENDEKGVAEYGQFKDGTVHITPYEEIAKRADFRTGAYQGEKNNQNPIGSGNTMKGFWSNVVGGIKSDPLHPLRATESYNHSFQAMTDEQRTMYNYLFHRYGADQADRYASALDDELNMKAGRQGAEIVSTMGGAPAFGLNMLASTAAGSERAVKGLGQAVDMVTGNYETDPISNFDGYLQHLQEKSSGAARIAYDLANSTGFMLPSMLAAPAAGAAMGATAGSAFGSAMFGAAAGGNSYADSIREGQDVETAQIYGALNAASETATQAILGGLNNVSIGHPRVKSAIDTAVRKMVTNPAVRDRMIQAAGYGADMAAEGLQEYTQELLDKASRNLLFGEKNKFNPADPEAWYAAMLGALNAGVLNAPGAIAQELDYRSLGKNIVPKYSEFADGIDTDQTYAAAETQQEARDLQELAQRYAQQQENGESISARDNGRFLERMENFTENVQQDEEITQNQDKNTQNTEENAQNMPDDVQEEVVQKTEMNQQNVLPEPLALVETQQETGGTEDDTLGELSDQYGKYGKTAYVDNYDHEMNLPQYSRTFDRVYDAGRWGIKMDEAVHQEALSTLGREKLENIWKAGAQDRDAVMSNMNRETGEPLNMTQGEARTGGLGEISENATSAQKTFAQYMGTRTGLTFDLVDGMERGGAVASYKKGKVTLDINSKDFLGSASHELTHFIRDYAPGEYNEYADTVIRQIMKSEGMDLQDGTESYINNYMSQAGQQLTREQAVEEIVADASQKFFNDEEFIKEVTQNRSLGQKILDFIDDVIDAIKNLIKTGSTRQSAKALEENLAYFQRARRDYMAGLETASERYKAGYEVQNDEMHYKIAHPELTTDEQIEKNFEKVRKSDPVVELEGDEFTDWSKKKPSVQVEEFYNSIGNKVHNDVIGDVILNKASVKRDIAHGIGKLKAITFKAVPDVIKNGEVLNVTPNWKGRQYDSIAVGARVDVKGGDRAGKYFVICTLHSDDTNRMYLHETGAIKMDTLRSKTGSILMDETSGAKYPSIDSLLEKLAEVNASHENSEGKKILNKDSAEGIRFQMEDMDDYLFYDNRYIKSILKENQELKDANALLKKEFTLTANEELRQEDIQKACRKILKEYNSKAKLDTVASNVTKLYEFIRSDMGNWDGLTEAATDIGRFIINQSQQKDTTLTEQYKDLRKQIKDTKILISDQDKADLVAAGGYNSFRQKYFGRMSLGKTGISVDAFYQELSSQHPDLFDADITHPADQLMQIGNVLDMTQPQLMNPYHANMDEMAYNVGQELLRECQNVREVPPTFADRKAAELDKVRREYARKMADYRSKTETQYLALLNEARRENEDMKEQHRRDLYYWNHKFKREQVKHREALMRKEAKNSIMKDITAMRKWLLKPTDKQHIPDGLNVAVANFLSNIDFSSKEDSPNGGPTQRTQAWEEAKKAFEEIKKTELIEDENGSKYYMELDPDLDAKLADLIEKTEDIKKLDDLDAYSMADLRDVVKAMKSAISNVNKLKCNQYYENVSDLGEAVLGDLNRFKKRKKYADGVGILDNLINVKMLDPVTVFHKIGPAGESLYDGLTSGWDKKTLLLKAGKDYFDKSLKECGLTEKDIRKWRGENAQRHKFEVTRGEIELTTAQVMELYVLNKRSQARRHMFEDNGGVVPGEVKLNTSLKEKRVLPVIDVSERETKLRPEDVKKITDTLTDAQKRLADKMQWYVNNPVSRQGNEVTVEMYGYPKFMAKDYWPIVTDKRSTPPKEQEARNSESAKSSIKNLGMTKNTNRNAKNPIVIEDIFDAFTRHVDQMSSYAGLMIPLSDLHKVLNYGTRGLDGNRNVQARISATLGEGTGTYLDNLINDINGSVHTRGDENIVDALMGNMKAAAVAGNLRVAVQQPGSIARAYAEMDAKYILKGLMKGADQNIINQYAPIAVWKDWGFYKMQTSRQMEDVLMGTDSVKDRIVNKTMILAELGDEITWKRIWNAVEYETMDKHPDLKKGSEEFYKKVGKRFSEIIYKTQVADSIMLRTEIMRSTGGIAKMATAFMGEPLKTYNMLYRAAWDLQSGRMDKKTAGKRAVKVGAAFAANAFLTAAAAAAIDMFRDDDDEKTLNEKYKSHMVANMIDNLNILGNTPYIKDIIETAVSGGTIQRSDLQNIKNVYYSWKKVKDVMDKKGKYTPQFAFLEATRSVSSLFGIPVKNVTRDAFAIINTVVSSMGDDEKYQAKRMKYDIALKDNRSMYVEMLTDAAEAKDKVLTRKILNDLLDAGWLEEDIEDQITSNINKEIKALGISDAADAYDYKDEKTIKAFEDKVDQFIELKKKAGKEKEKALENLYNSLDTYYKDKYKHAKDQAEKDKIIEHCNRLRYKKKAIFNSSNYENWKKQKKSNLEKILGLK